MTHDNVTDIVERATAQWDDITADPDTAIRREKWSVWANTTGLALIEEAATLLKQLENAREALRFYANHLSFPLNAWVQPTKVDYSMGGDGHWPDGPPIPSSELLADQGKIARKALKVPQ